MWRVLSRRDHEGGLGGELESAAGVVLQFGSYYLGFTKERLKGLLGGCQVVEVEVADTTRAGAQVGVGQDSLGPVGPLGKGAGHFCVVSRGWKLTLGSSYPSGLGEEG